MTSKSEVLKTKIVIKIKLSFKFKQSKYGPLFFMKNSKYNFKIAVCKHGVISNVSISKSFINFSWEL